MAPFSGHEFPNETIFEIVRNADRETLLSLSLTSKLIRQEALQILYHAVDLTHPYIRTLASFAYAIKSHGHLVRTFRLDCRDPNASRAEEEEETKVKLDSSRVGDTVFRLLREILDSIAKHVVAASFDIPPEYHKAVLSRTVFPSLIRLELNVYAPLFPGQVRSLETLSLMRPYYKDGYSIRFKRYKSVKHFECTIRVFWPMALPCKIIPKLYPRALPNLCTVKVVCYRDDIEALIRFSHCREIVLAELLNLPAFLSLEILLVISGQLPTHSIEEECNMFNDLFLDRLYTKLEDVSVSVVRRSVYESSIL